MKYFVIEGTLKNSDSIDETTMNEHIAYSQKAANAGLILVSGLKGDFSGGLSIMKGNSIEEVEAYLSADPLKISGTQDYRVIEFEAHFIQATASEWFKK
ncbi:YciI family protein [Clostridium gasigenes]|uniref:YciI family protein n=1 Tax=Clostridium gasigenes TaxID=94869 RepID=UPI001C0B0569|nr:YciI family protein [Clostridium gasigenes]MBU3138191.1 YciI family protein [Clostridium gasigenes]